ncbi:MAG TPA: outer membrane beta-barrel protein [Gemmatimonadaceae bacterium]
MIRQCMGLTVLAIVLGAPNTGAQRARTHSSSSSFSWSAGAGMSVPTGDLSNGAGNGYHFQGASSYHRLGWPIDLRAELAYYNFSSKDYTVAGARPNQTVNYTGKSSSIGGAVDASYALNSIGRMRPYLLGGPGVYDTRAEVTRAGANPTTSSETKVGLNVGGGINFSLVGRSAFLEARYNHVDQAAWVPITFGFRF